MDYERKCYCKEHEKFLSNANHIEILKKNPPHSEFVLSQRTHMDMHVDWRVHRIWNVTLKSNNLWAGIFYLLEQIGNELQTGIIRIILSVAFRVGWVPGLRASENILLETAAVDAAWLFFPHSFWLSRRADDAKA